MSALNRPKLLHLDEHTAALDPKTASKILYLTTLMITHNMHDAIQCDSCLIMMHEGNIVVDPEKKNMPNFSKEVT